MSARNFRHGQNVFDIHGRAGRYIAKSAHGHLVEAIYDANEDDDPHFAPAQTWPEVFSKPPTERLTADIQELVEELRAKRAELSVIESEIATARSVRTDLLRHAKNNPQLGDLHLWLEGKVTHIVALDHYAVEVGTVEQVLLKQVDRNLELRLLSLRVDPKANAYWVGRATYSDGSGSQTPCLLASSEEHANELARNYITEKLRNSNFWKDVAWLRIAVKFGVPITAEQQAFLREKKLHEANNYLKSTRDELERAQKRFEGAAADHAKATSQEGGV